MTLHPFPKPPRSALLAVAMLAVTIPAPAFELFNFGASFDPRCLTSRAMNVSLADGALEIRGTSSADKGPGVVFAVPTELQNLAGFGAIEVDIENTGDGPVSFTAWALSGNGWGGASTFTVAGGPASGRETLAPGQRGTFKIPLYSRYPGPDAFTPATNPAAIRWVELVFADNRDSLSLRLRSIQATGAGPARSPDVSRRVFVPDVTREAPGAGRRVYQQAPGWEKTRVTHVLTLPRQWEAGGRYPVLVEYTGNIFYHKFCHSTGYTDQGNMAYGLARGDDFICLNLPFVSSDGLQEQSNGWGDRQKTAAYCLAALRDVFARFGGDPSAVVLTGFSRGQIAMNYLALADDDIADVWLAFIGADPGRTWAGGNGWNNSHIGWDERARRLKGRPWFAEHPRYGPEVHVDVEYLEDSQATLNTRAWLQDVLRKRPGLHDVRGRVTDAAGQGIAGARVESGPTRFAIADAQGNYILRSVVEGERQVQVAVAGFTFRDPVRLVSVSGADVGGVDFQSEQAVR